LGNGIAFAAWRALQLFLMTQVPQLTVGNIAAMTLRQ
jgi:hypothetical protein